MLSQLQLKDSRYRSIEIEVNSGFDPDKDIELSLHTELKIAGLDDLEGSTDADKFVTVGMRLLNDPSADNFRVTFDIVIEGNFVLLGELLEWPKEEQLKLLRRNGGSLLYSQFREMFLHLTSRTSGNQMHMPTVAPDTFDEDDKPAAVKRKRSKKKKVKKRN